jgi:hypothetical protein
VRRHIIGSRSFVQAGATETFFYRGITGTGNNVTLSSVWG